jgi:tetratricopeptide (TPR) repeat protein
MLIAAAGGGALAGCASDPFQRISGGAAAAAAAASLDEQVRAAQRALDGGKPREAREILEQTARALGDDGRAYERVADALISRGRADAARDLLERAVRGPGAPGNDPLTWLALSRAAARTGDTNRSSAARREAVSRAERTAQEAGGASETDRGARADAAKRSAQAARLLEVGMFYLEPEVKNAPAALRALRRAYRLAPDDPQVLNALGYTLADEGRTEGEYDEALKLTRRALETVRSDPRFKPLDPIVADSVGWALFKTGDLQGARRVLREAVDDAPYDAQHEIRYHLGVVYAQLGLTEQADLEFRRALTLEPDYEPAKRAREQLKQPLGEGVVEGT